MSPTDPNAASAKQLFSKVPEVTAFFWMIKVLATTVDETAADFLNADLGFGLTGTSAMMSALLVVVLWLQFRSTRYTPWVYWLSVVLNSVVGTLITDNLVDNRGVSLEVAMLVFAAALTVTFWVWHRSEGTLSILSILTPRREGYYRAAILFTFALGTAGGDLLAEGLGLGFGLSAVIFAAAILVLYLSHRAGALGAIAAFWAAYILTRPLGASLGDLLSQAPADGGFGLGATSTSALFLTVILALVVYLSLTGIDLERVTRH